MNASKPSYLKELAEQMAGHGETEIILKAASLGLNTSNLLAAVKQVQERTRIARINAKRRLSGKDAPTEGLDCLEDLTSDPKEIADRVEATIEIRRGDTIKTFRLSFFGRHRALVEQQMQAMELMATDVAAMRDQQLLESRPAPTQELRKKRE